MSLYGYDIFVSGPRRGVIGAFEVETRANAFEAGLEIITYNTETDVMRVRGSTAALNEFADTLDEAGWTYTVVEVHVEAAT